MDLKPYIRQTPDFPKPGILFYDMAPLLACPDAWQVALGRMGRQVLAHAPDVLVGIESRGFLLAAPLALKLGCSLVMVRKPGKLPGLCLGHDYALEYGTDRLEIQRDLLTPGQRVVVVDDVLATGGTLAAACALVRQSGAHVAAAATLIELVFLGGRQRLDVPYSSVIAYI
ncbi:MAG: adenine phosphoribosyltransferase [Pseudomonadota bacterium]|nr:adenine phosphoribosyltransferase [Candidatus Acidoferrales bacterium]